VKEWMEEVRVLGNVNSQIYFVGAMGEFGYCYTLWTEGFSLFLRFYI